MGKSSTIFQVQFRWLFNTSASPNLNKHYLNLIFSIIFYQRHSMELPLNISRCRVGRLRLLNVRLLNLFHKMLKTILLKLRTSFTFLVSTNLSLLLFTKMAMVWRSIYIFGFYFQSYLYLLRTFTVGWIGVGQARDAVITRMWLAKRWRWVLSPLDRFQEIIQRQT